MEGHLSYVTQEDWLQHVSELEEALNSKATELVSIFNGAVATANSAVKVFSPTSLIENSFIVDGLTQSKTTMSLAQLKIFASNLSTALTAVDSVVSIGKTLENSDSGGDHLIDFLSGVVAGKVGLVAGTLVTGAAIFAGAPALAGLAIGTATGYLVFNWANEFISESAAAQLSADMVQSLGEKAGWAIYEATEGVKWLYGSAVEITEDVADFWGRDIVGTSGDDYFTLAAGSSLGGGSVEVSAGAGRDQIYGGKPYDIIHGGDDGDRIEVSANRVYGEGGDDEIVYLHEYAYNAPDVELFGGDGNDTISMDGTSLVKATIDGGEGFDTFIRLGSEGVSYLRYQGDSSYDVVNGRNISTTVHNFERVELPSGDYFNLVLPVSEKALVNSTIVGGQYDPEIALMQGGDYICVWTDTRGDEANLDKYRNTEITGRIIFNDLSGGGAEFHVNTTTDGYQRDAKVCVLEGGGFVVVWQSVDSYLPKSSDSTVRFQLFDENAQAVGGEVFVTSADDTYQSLPHVVAIEGGGFQILWRDGDSKTDTDSTSGSIRSREFNSTGDAVSAVNVVNDQGDRNEDDLRVTQMDNGSYAVIWTEYGGIYENSSIHSQLFDAAGKPIGSEQLPGAAVDTREFYPEVIAAPDGGYVVYWSDENRSRGSSETMLRRYGPDGEAIGDAISVASAAALKSGFALDDGRLALCFEEDVIIVDLADMSVSPIYSGLLGASWGQMDNVAAGIATSDDSFLAVWSADYRYTRADWYDEDDESIIAQEFFIPNENPDAQLNLENSLATGRLKLSGLAHKGQTLSIDASDVKDSDGLGEYTYRWYQDGVLLQSETGASYTLVSDDVGTRISASISYTDRAGFRETLTSAETAVVTHVNEPVTGTLTISGNAKVNEILTANIEALVDGDGFGALNYTWLRDDAVIVGATASSYTLNAKDMGATIKVKVSYIDGNGTAEAVISVATDAVTNDGQTSTANDDNLMFYSGADQVDAGAGSDKVNGGGGNDTIDGGTGADTLLGGTGSDELLGGAGEDTLKGGSGSDVLDGGTGDDSLNGGSGSDELSGGTGADKLVGGTGNDTLDGGKGADSLIGGNGADTLKGGAGDDALSGGKGNDLLKGGSGADELSGGSGNDKLMGEGGNDDLSGDSGNDTLIGGGGNDNLFGGAGDDSLSGGSGRDYLDGGKDDDILTGGLKADTFAMDIARGGNDTITDMKGADTLLFYEKGDVLETGTAEAFVIEFASVTEDGVLFDFADSTLLLEGVQSLEKLFDNVSFDYGL